MNRTLALALLLIGVFLGGLFTGERFEQSRQLRANQAAVNQGQAVVAKSVDQGASAVAAVQTQAANSQAVQNTIETELTHHVRRTVLTRVPACNVEPFALSGAHDRVALVDQRSDHAGAPQSLASTAGVGPNVGPADLPLTLGAVRLWNAALAGEFSDATLAADTCPADDPAAEACAANAGLSTRDAWLNHTVNATRCAQDRAQLEQLIALLRERQSGADSRPTGNPEP